MTHSLDPEYSGSHFSDTDVIANKKKMDYHALWVYLGVILKTVMDMEDVLTEMDIFPANPEAKGKKVGKYT